MQKAQIVAYFLVPADQDAPETIHPTMRPFHHPAPGFETGLLLEGLGFFPARPDVDSEAKLLQEISDLIIILAFIQAQSLRCLGGRGRPLGGDTFNRLARHFEVIAIRAVDGEPNRHALTVGEEAALGARCPASGGVLAHLLPPQGGLGLWPRPSPATPSQCPARRHRPPAPVPTRLQRHPPPSILGSADEPPCVSRCPWHPRRPIGIPCGARRRWHPLLSDHRPGADDSPKDAAYVGAARARYAPTTHQAYASHRGFSARHQASARLLDGRRFSPYDTIKAPTGIASNTTVVDHLL